MKKYIVLFFTLISIVHANEIIPSYQPQMRIENYIDRPIEEEFCGKSYMQQQEIISSLTSVAKNAVPTHQDAEHKQFYNAFEYLPQEAAYKLAVLYGSSLCTQPDYQRAEAYIQTSLIKPDASFAYGMILLKQKKEWDKAYEYFYTAGQLGIKQGYYNVAVMLYQKNARANMNKIFSLLKKSVAIHYERALLDLSILSLIHKQENIVYIFYQNNQKQPTIFNNFEQILTYLSQKNYDYANYNKAVFLYKEKKRTEEILVHLSKLNPQSFPNLPKFFHILQAEKMKEAKIDAIFATEYANAMDVGKFGQNINPENRLR